MSELRLQLTRDTPGVERTFGVLEYALSGQFLAHTMEPGTADRDFPRVPIGFYHLVPHTRPSGFETVALVGQYASHWQTPGVDRHLILIHSGNLDDHTQGCIVPGLQRGKYQGEPAVLNSGTAVARILDAVRQATYAYLRIR